MARKHSSKVQPDPQQVSLERIRALLDPADFAAMLAEIQRPLPPAIRLNPLKATPSDLKDWCERYQWQVEPIPFCSSGYRLTSSQTNPGGTLEHLMGQYYIQEAASMLPPELFDFNSMDTPLILDMAASPGGKTTHLISKTGDQGLVIANDSSADRIQALRLVLLTWGGLHTAVTQFPGERWGTWYPETFDAVLLDAPCSMQGLRGAESHTIRPITDHEINGLARRQVGLLTSALQAVRVGGQVVYSTCTLTAEEDEGVLDALLRRYPGAIQVEDVRDRIPVPAPALTQLPSGEQLDPQIAHALRLFPHRLGTAGFFAARLTKTAPIPVAEQIPPSRPLAQAGFEPVTKSEQMRVVQALGFTYGFDLPVLLEQQAMELWHRDETLYLFPRQFLIQFSGLPVALLGLPLGDWQADTFIPSHEWLARFASACPYGWLTISDDDSGRWLQGADLPPIAEAVPPICLIKDSAGRFLGRARAGKDRLKNLLPRRFFA